MGVAFTPNLSPCAQGEGLSLRWLRFKIEAGFAAWRL